MKWILFFMLCVLVSSCKESYDQNKNFSIPPTSTKCISLNDISMDTILLENVPISYEIESSINNDKVYLVDRYFTTIYEYTPSGQLIKKYLGKGRAKNETTIGRIATHTFTEDNLFLLNTSGAHYYYDDNFMLQNLFLVSYEEKYNKNNIYETPTAYTHCYGNIVCRSYKNDIFFNVMLLHLETNIINTTSEHLKRSANIFEVDTRKQDLGRLLAVGYPASYSQDTESKVLFSSVYFDIGKDGTFYVTYEADSLIYVYNDKFDMQKCYGMAGSGMDLNYVAINDVADIKKYNKKERATKGYYNWIEYVEEQNILFRSYQKGAASKNDGLQIYNDGVLIGDVEVPKGLKVMGYIEPYYYSYVIPDEGAERIYMYRFNL